MMMIRDGRVICEWNFNDFSEQPSLSQELITLDSTFATLFYFLKLITVLFAFIFPRIRVIKWAKILFVENVNILEFLKHLKHQTLVVFIEWKKETFISMQSQHLVFFHLQNQNQRRCFCLPNMKDSTVKKCLYLARYVK